MNLPTLEELLILVDEYGDQCWNDGRAGSGGPREIPDATQTARAQVVKQLEAAFAAFEVKDHVDVYVVYSNRDLTEGRGEEYPMAVCTHKSTAMRLGKNGYVQGSDCPIEKRRAVKVGGLAFFPASAVHIHHPTAEDLNLEKRWATREAVLKKLRDAGLTEQDIMILQEKM